MNPKDPRLCVADDATFWPWSAWPDFASRPDREATVVVVPLAGLADWGLGHALDAEETVLMHVLREASLRRAADVSLLVVPVLRFVPGPGQECAFAVDPDVASGLIEEVVGSIASAGFRRVVLFNSSPWNEELCRAVGRDLRIARGVQMFCVNLSGLGLDFHPERGGDRASLKAALATLAGGAAAAASSAAPAPAAAQPNGAEVLDAAAARLASLLGEIRSRPPLAHLGALPPVAAPSAAPSAAS